VRAVTGFFPRVPLAAPGNLPRLLLALLSFCLLLASVEPGAACRGYQWWSSGEDPKKLKPDEFAVKAKLLASYTGDQKHSSIMGPPTDAIYHVQIVDVVGSAPEYDGNIGDLRDTKIYVLAPAHVCETYRPRNFSDGAAKLLVLKKYEAGLYLLVGGK
jgi:hypothetical protein